MKKLAVLIILLCLRAAGADAQNSAVQAMLNTVSADSLMSYDAALERASGYFSRVAYTPGNDSSVQYIYRTLKRYPAAITRVERDTFYVDSTTYGSAKAPYNTRPLYNVFGMIKGKKDTMTVVVVGAHLDTYAGRESTWTTQWQTIRAPGADDNGTGVSAVLESARIFANAAQFGFSNDYTIVFAAFNAEEASVPELTYPLYLYGSSHLATRLRLEGYKVAAMINIDMVGFNKNLTSNIVSDSKSLPIAQTSIAVNAQYGLGLAMNAPPFDSARYSDHSSFWGNGFPAILLIEHAPPNVSSSNYTINTLYHTSHDTLGAVNPELVKRSTELAIGTAAYYAVSHSSSSVTRLGSQAPAAFSLAQNFPNPFNPSTTLRFSIAESRFVDLRIVDVLGREVATLVKEPMQPGTYSVDWNAGGLPSGMYVAVLRAVAINRTAQPVFIETKKLLMQK
jgi:hypothetical protein